MANSGGGPGVHCGLLGSGSSHVTERGSSLVASSLSARVGRSGSREGPSRAQAATAIESANAAGRAAIGPDFTGR